MTLFFCLLTKAPCPRCMCTPFSALLVRHFRNFCVFTYPPACICMSVLTEVVGYAIYPSALLIQHSILSARFVNARKLRDELRSSEWYLASANEWLWLADERVCYDRRSESGGRTVNWPLSNDTEQIRWSTLHYYGYVCSDGPRGRGLCISRSKGSVKRKGWQPGIVLMFSSAQGLGLMRQRDKSVVQAAEGTAEVMNI